MRVAILSDVHANLEALIATRAAIAEEDVERIYCLGDIVGYGGWPNECCRIVRRMVLATVLGNHDAAVAKRMNYDYYYDSARNVLDYHARILHQDNLDWLKSLPYTLRLPELETLLTHGSPLHPESFDYIFEIDHVERLMTMLDRLPLVTFLGHSHLCKVYLIEDYEVQEIPEREFRLSRQGGKYVVSVGSVGQPRDLNNQACHVILDTQDWRVTFRRVDYDIEGAGEKIRTEQGDPNFAQRLILGW